MIIHKLDPIISNKIAAGEVVERPAAVIKELVENAIDAGSTHITIEIKEAGKALIRVSDNGSGMGLDDLPLAFERHATSKIAAVEDIYRIQTLGFRGEALASIASVSRIECITRTKEDTAGVRLFVNAGVLSSSESVGTTVGTTLIVRDLFFNTPVRYKFLKSNQAEQTAIVDLVNKLALSHADISFTLLVDGREVYRTDGRGKLINALLAIYGRNLITHLIPIEASTAEGDLPAELGNPGPGGAGEGPGEMTISGYISRPSYTRGNRNYQMLFVNGRFVKSEDLQKTVFNAYKGLMTIGQFPAFALHIHMPYDQVDVNIHPSKTEIRFKEPLAVEGFVFTTIKSALMSIDLVPKSGFGNGQGQGEVPVVPPVMAAATQTQTPTPISTSAPVRAPAPRVSLDAAPQVSRPVIRPSSPAATGAASSNLDPDPDSYSAPDIDPLMAALDAGFSLAAEGPNDVTISNQTLEPTQPLAIDGYLTDFFATDNTKVVLEQMMMPVVPLEKETLYDGLIIVGQLFETYIVTQRGKSAYLIDQHAAHERILFEEFLARFKNHNVESQMLLAPFVYQGDAAHYAHQETAMAWLSQLGVLVESFGEREWVVRAVPIIHGEPMNQDAVSALIDAFEEHQGDVLEETFVEDVIRQSCKAAIKANHSLSHREIQGLFDALKTLENPYTCPHGRPIMVEMSEREIEKRFKRT